MVSATEDGSRPVISVSCPILLSSVGCYLPPIEELLYYNTVPGELHLLASLKQANTSILVRASFSSQHARVAHSGLDAVSLVCIHLCKLGWVGNSHCSRNHCEPTACMSGTYLSNA